MRKIKKMKSTIENTIFSKLNSMIGLNMNKTPSKETETTLSYRGELDEKPVILEFSSNYSELDDYNNKNSVFGFLYYGARGTKIGVLDLDLIDSCVEIIYDSFLEIGYKPEETTPIEDVPIEKEQPVEAKEPTKVEEPKVEPTKVEEPTEPEENFDPRSESQESLNDSLNELDKLLTYMNENNSVNARVEIMFMFDLDNGDVATINLDLYYINKTKCLAQANSKYYTVDKETEWEKVKEFMKSVAEKKTAVVSVSGYDENDTPIDTTKLGSDEFDLGATL